MTTKDFLRSNPIEKLMRKHGNDLVSVTYPDGKNSHTLTVYEVEKRFAEETWVWREHFLFHLIKDGNNTTNFGAEYSLIDK